MELSALRLTPSLKPKNLSALTFKWDSFNGGFLVAVFFSQAAGHFYLLPEIMWWQVEGNSFKVSDDSQKAQRAIHYG